MLVITGSGRCGTTCLAEFGRLCGYAVGGGYNRRVHGGREHVRFRNLNDAILRGEDVTAKMRRFRRRLVKDPRLFLVPRALAAWWSCRKDLKVVFCTRPADQVFASLARHHSFFVKSEAKYPARRSKYELQKRVVGFLRDLHRLRVPYRHLRFPDFLRQYDKVYEAFVDFGGLRIDYAEGKAIWEKHVDWSKVHTA